MSKKLIFIAASLFIITVTASAYTPAPAVGGESIFELSSPFALTQGSSVVGGGIFSAGTTSIIANPALSSHEQRVGLNLGYTALVGTAENNNSFGSAFQTAIMIPFRWAVFTGYVNGTFPNAPYFGYIMNVNEAEESDDVIEPVALSETDNADEVPETDEKVKKNDFIFGTVGGSINAKASLSKEISDHLSVGIGLNGGGTWGTVPDWSLSANLGFVYTIGNLAFMKDFRYGVSIMNLGKNYATINEAGFLDRYPGFATVKFGAGALLLSNDTIKLGASLDFTTPCFTNLITDIGLQFSLKDMLTVNVSEKINLLESIKGVKNYVPSIGVFFRFTFDVKGNEYLERHDWSESEMTVAMAYKNLYENVQSISAGVDLSLGLKDETPPQIVLWTDEDEE